MKAIHSSILSTLLALMTGCGRHDVAGPGGEGNGSETVARGIVVDSTGAPATGVGLQLLPVDHNPVSSDTLPASFRTVTGDGGEYRFDGIGAGTYNLEAGSTSAGLKALVMGIECTGQKSEVTVDTGRLRKTGTVLVNLTGMSSHDGDYLYIPGTNSFALVTAHDTASHLTVVNGVPAGAFTDLIYVTSTGSQSTDLLDDTLTVVAGDTVASEYAAWKYAAKLFLNTAVSGAGITGNVYDFPVLVRLNDSLFDFSQGASDGEDLRFTKSDGLRLSHEIERWDASAGKAEIWVNVDTVYGNDSTQSILMYWGNPDASSGSVSPAVFDTANGFIGVWHMNEDPSKGEGTIKDRTANGHDATPFGSMSLTSLTDGIVGRALSFDGTDDYLNAGNVPVPGTYTVGLWVRIGTLGHSQRFIFKDSSYTLWYDSINIRIRMEHMARGSWWRGLFQDGGTTVPMTQGEWHYLTGTFDGTVIRLYDNGAEVSRSDEITGIPIDNSFPLLFGKSWDIDYVAGIMDEIRIEGSARPADWIRLCFMNQRGEDKLVVFRKRPDN